MRSVTPADFRASRKRSILTTATDGNVARLGGLFAEVHQRVVEGIHRAFFGLGQPRSGLRRFAHLAHDAGRDGLALVVLAQLHDLELEADLDVVCRVLLLRDPGYPAAIVLLDSIAVSTAPSKAELPRAPALLDLPLWWTISTVAPVARLI